MIYVSLGSNVAVKLYKLSAEEELVEGATSILKAIPAGTSMNGVAVLKAKLSNNNSSFT